MQERTNIKNASDSISNRAPNSDDNFNLRAKYPSKPSINNTLTAGIKIKKEELFKNAK